MLRHFSKLIHPIAPDAFVERYYEQQLLHIPRTSPDYFADVLTADDLDRLFQHSAMAKSIMRMNKEGFEVRADKFAESEDNRSDRISIERVLKLFQDGYTIILNSANLFFPALDQYCRGLERELKFRVQPNIYITPFNARGFQTHYDDHDVFIMQVMGTKNWRVFHSAVELPSSRQSFKASMVFPLDTPQLAVTVKPGDTLYIPRGVLHDAATDGTTSVHITMGLHPLYRHELLQELTAAAQDIAAFRKSVPLGLLRDRRQEAAEIKRLLIDLVNGVDVDQLIEARYRSHVSTRRVDLRGRFTDLAHLNRVNLNTVVRKRQSVVYTLDRNDRLVTVGFSGIEIPLQPFLTEAIDMLLGDEAFAVRDIKGFLSDAARLELATRFLKSGFLEVVDLKSE